MSCEHEVRFTIKPTDDACRFHFDVRAYKDRIVTPDEYSGATEVTPSDSEQVLPTTDKLVRDDITVHPAPTEYLSTDHNGTFTPSDGKVGFSQVDVNVNPDLRPLSVNENGSYQPDGFDGYSDVTVDVEPNLETLNVTENGLYLPESGVDGFDRVNVDVPVPSGSMEITDNGTYNVANKESVNVMVEGQWIDYDDVPVTLPEEYQRVEYIKSSGTQHIDLPFGFYPTDYVSVKGSIDDISNTSGKYMITPIRWNHSNSNRFTMLAYNYSSYGKCFCAGYGNVSATDTILRFPYEVNTDIHLFVYKKHLFYSPDLSIAIGVKNIVFRTETLALRLFYGLDTDTAGKICYYIHEKADGRKLALYACYRKSDGVIGMYDVENDVFYTNDGSGDFTKGQDI